MNIATTSSSKISNASASEVSTPMKTCSKKWEVRLHTARLCLVTGVPCDDRIATLAAAAQLAVMEYNSSLEAPDHGSWNLDENEISTLKAERIAHAAEVGNARKATLTF